jgi:D-psicose/D-tagatose/L-ribulose 3-epimerase
VNRVGIHYGYFTRNWKTDFAALVRRAAALGFDAMDFATADIMALPPGERRDLRDLAGDMNVELAFAPATGPEVDIASKDSAVRAHGVDYFRRNVEFTAEMGGRIFAGIIYSAWQAKVEGLLDDKTDALARSLDALREILPTAEECGVLYCLEVVNRFEQYLLNTAEEGVAFVDALGSPNAKLLLDTFHMNIEEDDMGKAIRLAGNRLAHFHIGECNRKVPGSGSGRMPWVEIFDALHDVDYRGTITMEPFVRMGGEVGKAICVWRDLVDGGDERLDLDAAEACRFVRRHLQSRM